MLNYVLLFAGAFVAAFISGSAGFGGALLLLPLLVSNVGVTKAVPLLTITQLIGNLSRIWFGISQIRWKAVGLFLFGAVPFTILGAISFIRLPNDLMTKIVGVVILLFIVLKHYGVLKMTQSSVLLIISGGVVGFLSGLIGSAGPLGAAVFLSLDLPPLGYIASEATTAIVIHSVKIVIYQHFISLDKKILYLSILMGIAMIAGTWCAKRIIIRLPRKVFQTFVTILLIIISIYMIITG